MNTFTQKVSRPVFDLVYPLFFLIGLLAAGPALAGPPDGTSHRRENTAQTDKPKLRQARLERQRFESARGRLGAPQTAESSRFRTERPRKDASVKTDFALMLLQMTKSSRSAR